MEVLHVYYTRALASVYNEGLYAKMYFINLAAVSTCDYTFELVDSMCTRFVRKLKIGGRFQATRLATH